MKDLFHNQIALALLVFIVIVSGAYWKLDSTDAKEIIIQVVTAIGSLVTGYSMRRSTDKD